MFRIIGGAVVYGLAVYGVVKLLDTPVVGRMNVRASAAGQRNRIPAAEGGGDLEADAGHAREGGEAADPPTADI